MSKSTPALTIGLEEELFLVDSKTGDLCSQWPPGLKEQCQKDHPDQVVAEFLSAQVELITKPCQSIQELHQQFSELRQYIITASEQYGISPLAVSSHPNACWREQIPNKADRYERLDHVLQMTARRLLVGGMHIHVGIEDREERLRVLNEVTWYLPLMLSLSSSSPFWAGMNSGLSSFRLSVLSGLPRSGLPEFFDNFQQYQEYLAHLLDSGAMESERELWWDIRLSGRFPTIEARITDTCTSMMDAMAIAALYRCLIHWIMRTKQSHNRDPKRHHALIQENRWRAQRYSLRTGSLLHHQENSLWPYAQLLEEILDNIELDAEILDCVDYIDHIKLIYQRGTSSDHQKSIYNEAISEGMDKQAALTKVTKYLIKETASFKDSGKKKRSNNLKQEEKALV